MNRRVPTSRAFTITELLVVMSIIILLLALVLPGLTGARLTAKNTVSRSNMRQLHVGLTVFANQNRERLMSPTTARSFVDQNIGLYKSKAWVESTDATLEDDPDEPFIKRESQESLRAGWAYEYCGDAVFRSPLDISGRVRSYSMNGFISEKPDPFYMQSIDPYLPIEQGGLAQPPAATLAMIRHPDRMMHLIPERHQFGDGTAGSPGFDYNLHGFLMDLVTPVWVDIPAFFSKDGVNIAYMDGRVERHMFYNGGAGAGGGAGGLSDAGGGTFVPLYKALRENWTVHDGPDWEFFSGIMMPGLERRMGLPQTP